MNAFVSDAGALVSVYIVFALMTSRVSEAIATFTNKRGETLYDGIVALLGATERTAQNAGAGTKALSLAEHLYAHPLISNLGESGPRKPSYMPARTFTLSLVSVLRETVKLATDGGEHPIDVKSGPDALLADLQDRIAKLGPNDPTARSLTLVLQDAEKTYDGALRAIDGWFDDQMDRVSGVYKRWSGTIQAVIALVLVVASNADTLAILQQLIENSSAASALAAVGTGAKPDQTVVGTVNALTNAGLRLGWTWPIFHGDGRAVYEVLAKIGGLAITWGAVLLGAPFWFDLLKQIVPVRVSGAKPAPSDPGAPKQRDRQVVDS